MKKIYSLVIILLTFIIIASSYSYAGIIRSNDSLLTLGAVSSDGSDDSDSNSGSSESDDDSSIGISTDNNLIITSNNDTLIDKFPKAYIVMISPNPAFEHGITNLIGWVKNPFEPKVIFEWDFGDGEKYTGEGIGAPLWCNITHKFNRSGEYLVKLSLIKDGKILSNYSILLKVISLPVFFNTGGPYYGIINEKIFFKCLVSSTDLVNSENNIVSYKWDFGDGTVTDWNEFEYKQRVSHQYDKIGIYPVILTVMDKAGEIYSDSTTVTVVKITIAIHPSNPSAGEEVTFGVDVIGFKPSKFYWTFNDESKSRCIEMGQTITHTFSVANTYYGQVSFNKEFGNLYSDFMVVVNSDIIKNNQEPVSFFKVVPSSGDLSTIFEFDASSSFDKDGKIVLYEWYFGDGKTIVTKNSKCSYMFDKEGVWKVKCLVIDDKGDYNSYSKSINVFDNGDQSSSVDLSDQKGLLFYGGNLYKIESEPADYQDQKIDTNKACDLKISVDIESEISSVDTPVKMKIIVNDLLDSYDEDSIVIQLLSDIPGYKIVSYTAQRNQKSQDYEMDIEIPLSEDSKSYTIVIVANPNQGFAQQDNSANRWSDTISIKSDVKTDGIDSLINYTQTFGSLSI